MFDTTPDAADNPLIWFDAGHDGLVQPGVGGECPFGGPVEDYIGYSHGAFIDRWYCNKPSFIQDADGGGTHGAAAASHVFPDWVFEFSHPLDSTDPDDYAVATGDTLGWCFTYNNASDPTNSTAVGELQYPPGCWFDANSSDDAVQGSTLKYADLEKETLTHDSLQALKDKLKGLVATCDFCPPDPRAKLREKIINVVTDLKADNKAGAISALKAFIRSTRKMIGAERLPAKEARRFVGEARDLLGNLAAAAASPGSIVPGPGAHSANPIAVGPNGQEGRPPRGAQRIPFS